MIDIYLFHSLISYVLITFCFFHLSDVLKRFSKLLYLDGTVLRPPIILDIEPAERRKSWPRKSSSRIQKHMKLRISSFNSTL